MRFAIRIHGRTAACALAALSLSACATGQGSFVAGSGGSGDGGVQEFAEDAPLDEAAPGLLAASGNALLPGVRNTSPAALAAGAPALLGGGPVAGLSTGPVAANVDASVNLLGGGAPAANLNAGLATSLAAANVNAKLGGPLLALNGSPSALLNLGVAGPTVLGATPNLTVNVGGALNPATAATQTLISATVGVTQQPTTTPSQPSTGQPPLLPPVLGVPGTTPLQTLLPLLTAPSTTPKPPVLPGL
jgi:hypothetical protein